MSIPKNISRISIVGAGPGAVDLITVRGLRALQSADVVLYDALVHPDLLLEAPAEAIQIYVGKRAGNHRYPQEKINQIMVQAAYANGHVVRLKGGDPFVFGRGHEEMEYAESFGIKVDIIPGISSCIAVPALLKVPLTRRGINESFWVLTATTRSGALSKDIAIAAQSSATMVILMGLRKLPEIVALLKQMGQQNSPVMIVENGSLPQERCVSGTVCTIEKALEKEPLNSPAIILIGEVVKLYTPYKIEKPQILSKQSTSLFEVHKYTPNGMKRGF